ncbi:MAG: hypothetical protein ACRD1N_06450 [Terriglobia bacterium]
MADLAGNGEGERPRRNGRSEQARQRNQHRSPPGGQAGFAAAESVDAPAGQQSDHQGERHDQLHGKPNQFERREQQVDEREDGRISAEREKQQRSGRNRREPPPPVAAKQAADQGQEESDEAYKDGGQVRIVAAVQDEVPDRRRFERGAVEIGHREFDQLQRVE